MVGGGAIEARQLASLRFTEFVVRESLRLFPPFWHVAREAKRDVILGGRYIARGTLLLVMTHLMHRNGAYFERPDEFLPDRWRDEAHRQALPKLAYSPFGAGQRKCIGQLFAMTELISALATIVPQVDLETTASRPTAQPAATLRPADGIRLSITRRPRALLRAGAAANR